MGSLFRSREMALGQLFLQSDSAYACIRELGELGKVHFRDLNPEVSAFQRKFVNEVRRCDEMERKLRFLSKELENAGIQPVPAGHVDAPDPQYMIDLESRFEELESDVKEINGNTETLKRNLLDLVELRHIINAAQGFFETAEAFSQQQTTPPVPSEETKGPGLLNEEEGASEPSNRLTFVAGVIRRERLQRFEQVLWRACRGNVYVQQAEIDEPLEDPSTGEHIYKNVFILFFQGDQLRLRVKKICEGFRATLYECPPTAAKRRDMSLAITGRIEDLNMVLGQTQDHSIAQLQEIANQIDGWKQKVIKIKSIFHTMNKFNLDVTAKCLIAECWYPVEYSEEVQQALMRGTELSGSSVPSILHRIQTDEAPPTYNKTNKVTVGFQAIVDAYGVSTYQEVNPAPYAVITFPFLFAVMFGDAGHGFLMALFAFLLILREKKLANSKAGGELFSIIFNGRYIIFLMGLFSIYTGLIYNDCFSKSFNIFGSKWNVSYQKIPTQSFVETGEGESTTTFLPTEAFKPFSPYPFGIDPIWQVSVNKLLYINSYKMKLAVILGVTQMTFGIILSILNYLHFKSYIRIISDFIPQLLFLLSLFGYLMFLIVVKWCSHWDNTSKAPSILITMINMFLGFGSKPDDYPPQKNVTSPVYPLYGGDVASYQKVIQVILVIVAFSCVPAMLCIKPVYLFVKHKRSRKREYSPQNFNEKDDDDEAILHPNKIAEDGKGKDDTKGTSAEPSFSLMEIVILQAIHTIEFCLSCISHTASYLRLWALSLAHAELSEVLWSQILNFGYTLSYFKAITLPPIMATIISVIFVFLGFSLWAFGTLSVLLVMEGLSAFLHTLRLHWVEFQSKFFSGEGYKFQPFSFATILAGDAK